MSKTATITCEFEYELCIGQLTPEDEELVREGAGFGTTTVREFYSAAPYFHGEVISQYELDRLVNLVKDSLLGKLQASLPRHFASNGRAKIVSINVIEFSYRNGIRVDQRTLKVYALTHITLSIEATLDDNSEIDREKLFTVISDRYADDAWSGETAQYMNVARFGELEIEYR